MGQALAGAEEVLSDSIIQHLKNFIEQIDRSIAKKIKHSLEKMKEQNRDIDPMQRIKTTLIHANKERLRINNETNKRKRNNNEEETNNDKTNKNKKFKKNNKDRS